MKTILNLSVVFVLSIISFFPASSQTNTCFTANPFCSSNSYNFPNATSGTAPSGPSYGCLTTRPRPIWYYMEIDVSGTIDILLQQTTGPNGGGTQIDVDFAMWGPFSSLNAGCNAIMAGGLPPIQCSYSTSYSEDIGLGVQGGYAGGQSTPPAAIAGEFYIVLLTNYNGASGYISFNQTGGTGSADCSIVEPCSIDNFVANVTACAPLTANYSVNGTINVTNPPSTGQLIVRDCNGNQTIVASAPFNASSYPYNLTGLVADGAGCSVEAYFSNDATCSALLTYTAPLCNGCSMTNLTANVGLCQTDGTYGVTGAVSFSNPPATGTMTVTTSCGGTQTFNAPFTSPINYSIAGLPANGNPCNVTASFSAITSCQTVTPITAPTFLTPIFDTIPVCIGATPPALPTMSAEAIPGTWSPSTINTSTAGTFNYTFTPSSNECAGLGTLIVVVNPLPDVQVPPTQTLYECQTAATVSLSGSSTTSGAVYQWTGPGIVSGASTANAVVNATGNYVLTVTNPLTGCSNTNSMTVITDTVQPLVSIDSPIAISCDNPTVTLSANSPTPGATFVWTPNPGIVSSSPTLTPTVNQAGSYQITVTGPNSCTNSATVAVAGDTQLPNINTTPSSFVISCSNQTVTINGSSTTPGVSYSWTGPGIVSGGTTYTPTVNAAGTYTLTVTDPVNSCTNSASVTVNFIPFVTPDIFSDTTICGNTFQIPASSIVANGNITWVESIGNNGTFSNPSVTAPLFTGENGVVNYTLRFTDACGLSASANVTLVPRPQITAPSVSCDLAEYGINVQSYDGGVWTVVENPSTPYVEDTTLTFEYGDTLTGGAGQTGVTVSHHGTYTLYFNNNDLCPDTSITLNFPPYLWTEINDTVLCIGEEYQLNAWQTPYVADYNWNTGATGTSIIVNQPGEYIVTVSNICHSYGDTAYIQFETCDIDAPNVISLSSKDGNNLWFVNSHGIAEFECVIVNRWGNLIYEYNDINGSWNGRDLGGHLVSEGVYFYTIKAKMVGGEEIKKHGFIHVVY